MKKKKLPAQTVLTLIAHSILEVLIPVVLVCSVGGSVLIVLFGIVMLWLWSPYACICIALLATIVLLIRCSCQKSGNEVNLSAKKMTKKKKKAKETKKWPVTDMNTWVPGALVSYDVRRLVGQSIFSPQTDEEAFSYGIVVSVSNQPNVDKIVIMWGSTIPAGDSSRFSTYRVSYLGIHNLVSRIA